jgi:formylglycine-generating enzyme required for sulfatase activity
MKQTLLSMLVAVGMIGSAAAQIYSSDTFGTGDNQFSIDFTTIGNPGNAADTTTYGAVPYEYRMGKYEISQEAITKATASGMTDVTAGAWTGNQPAANISWYGAAAFVNWLNTSAGKTAAYNLTFSGSWSMQLWSSEQAWTAGGENLYRNKDAFYFLPSENEWYKAAYYNPVSSDYFLYPTASSTAPTAVASGTDASTAVYNKANDRPAAVNAAGGLSPYSTMGQGGNVWEMTESGVHRGGNFWDEQGDLESSRRSPFAGQTDYAGHVLGFRVASVPEPSTYALLLLSGAASLWALKRRKS